MNRMQNRPDSLRSSTQGNHDIPSTHKDVNHKISDGYVRNGLSLGKQAVNLMAVQLGEACTCYKCVDPIDHQRHFVFADIPTNISIGICEVNDNGHYLITWKNDIPGYQNHVSPYSRAEMERFDQHHTLPEVELSKRPKRLWNASTFDMEDSTISYQEYMNNDAGLARLLHLVARDGLAFIDGIPTAEDSVNKMAERVGPLRTTFYGETWDVKSMPQATNVAYTSRYLGFHMDMLYVREPPGLQFLHCLENTCNGGESRFADTFNAADQLISQQGPAAFDALQSLKIKYHYRRPGIYTSAIKPVFDTTCHEAKPMHNFTNASHPDLINTLHRVYWSPPFIGRAMGNDKTSDIASQLQASKAFHDILEHQNSVIETKLPAGTCAVFDNFRIVHARQAFDLNSGQRWLRVAYVDDSDFQSRAVTLVDRMPPHAEGMS